MIVTPELHVAKWIASNGLERIAPESPSRDTDAMLAVIQRHRLIMRFRDKARRSKMTWCPSRMSFELWSLYNRASSGLRYELDLIHEISALAASTNEPIIVMKGVSTYGLTGNERNIRVGGDIDFMASDLGAVCNALIGRGFTGAITPWAVHEYATLKRPGAKLEPHRYFQVFSYPPDMIMDYPSAACPGRITQGAGKRVQREVLYEDLLAHCQHGIAPGTEAFTFPNPSMAVLILCAHEFRSFIRRPYNTRSPFVSLSTLADIVDLAAAPKFDRDEFLAIVERFEAQTTVGFALGLIQNHLGVSPLQEISDMIPPLDCRSLPQQLTSYGGWAVVQETPDDLLTPLASARLFERIGFNSVVASDDSLSYSARQDVYASGLPQITVHDLERQNPPNASFIEFDLHSVYSECILTLNIEIQNAPLPGFNYHVDVTTPEGFGVWYDAYINDEIGIDGVSTLVGKQSVLGPADARLKESSCKIAIRVQDKHLVLGAETKQYFSCMLMITRWPSGEQDIHKQATPVMCVPLRITIPDDLKTPKPYEVLAPSEVNVA